MQFFLKFNNNFKFNVMKRGSIFFLVISFSLFFFSCDQYMEDENETLTQLDKGGDEIYTKDSLVIYDVNFHRFDNDEIFISLNENKESGTDHYFVVQGKVGIYHEDLIDSTYAIYYNGKDSLVLQNRTKKLIFSFEKNEDQINETGDTNIRVYGIAEIYNEEEKMSLESLRRMSMQCYSGGPGATSCSAGSGALGVEGSCSVTCDPRQGKYACCDDTINECKCVEPEEYREIDPYGVPNLVKRALEQDYPGAQITRAYVSEGNLIYKLNTTIIIVIKITRMGDIILY